MIEKEMSKREKWAAQEPELIGLWKEGQRAKKKLEACPDFLEDQRSNLQYAVFKGEDAAECIITHYGPLIDSIAVKYLGKGVPWKELMQIGKSGLSEALSRYDPERGKNLLTFAYKRIRGSIFDFFSDNSPFSRGTYEYIRKMDEVRKKLLKSLSREPTNAELAAKMGMDEDEVQEIQEVSKITCIPLEELFDEDEEVGGWDDLISDGKNIPGESDGRIDLPQLAKVVEEAKKDLSPRERKIFQQILFTDTPLKKIGKSLGVSESRISQLWIKCVLKLRRAAEEKGLVEPDPSFRPPLLTTIRSKSKNRVF